jgi:hypothetical protein
VSSIETDTLPHASAWGYKQAALMALKSELCDDVSVAFVSEVPNRRSWGLPEHFSISPAPQAPFIVYSQ